MSRETALLTKMRVSPSRPKIDGEEGEADSEREATWRRSKAFKIGKTREKEAKDASEGLESHQEREDEPERKWDSARTRCCSSRGSYT